jgi:hypothetical protein
MRHTYVRHTLQRVVTFLTEAVCSLFQENYRCGYSHEALIWKAKGFFGGEGDLSEFWNVSEPSIEVKLMGHVVAQAVSLYARITEVWVRSQADPCRVCGEQSGSGTGFSMNTSVFPSKRHSTVAPPSFSPLSLALYNVSR